MDLSLDDIIKQNKKTAKRPAKKLGTQNKKTTKKTAPNARRPTKKPGIQNRKIAKKTAGNTKTTAKPKPVPKRAQNVDPCAMSLEDIIRNKKTATKTALRQRQIAKSKAKRKSATGRPQPLKAAKRTIQTKKSRKIQTKVTASGKVVKVRKIQRALTTKERNRAKIVARRSGGGVSARSKVIQKKRVRATENPKKVIKSARDVSDARLYLLQKSKKAVARSPRRRRQETGNRDIPSTSGTRNARNWSAPSAVSDTGFRRAAPSTSGLRSAGFQILPAERHDLRHQVRGTNQRSFISKNAQLTHSVNYRSRENYDRSPPGSSDYHQLRRTITSNRAPREMQPSGVFDRHEPMSSGRSHRHAVPQEPNFSGVRMSEYGSSAHNRHVQYEPARSTTLETLSHRYQPGTSQDRRDISDRHYDLVVDGYRVVISNLPGDINRDDIVELFEAMGRLKDVRLIRPGIGEVVFFSFTDAKKAIDTYHNRRLDDRPMKCRLLSPR